MRETWSVSATACTRRSCALILQSWKFPAELVVVPVEYLRFDRAPPRADYADLVQVATLQSLVGTDHPFAALDFATIGAFKRVGASPEVASLDVADLGADMKDAAALLA